MKTLIQNVFRWGIDRDLYKYSSVPTQLVKLAEEFFEYEDAEESLFWDKNGNKAQRELNDAKGDMLIVALNMFGVKIFKEKGECSAEKLADIFYDLRRDYKKTFTDDDIKTIIRKSLPLIIRSKMPPESLCYELIDYYREEAYDLLRCAYNDIKDRKGKLTPDGNFVKESDQKSRFYILGLTDDNQVVVLDEVDDPVLAGSIKRRHSHNIHPSMVYSIYAKDLKEAIETLRKMI